MGVITLNNIFQWLSVVNDIRQQAKVKHLMKDIILIVFFATLANADDWEEIHCFALGYEKFLRKYLELPHGIPSEDTIRRVFGIVSPEFLQAFSKRWNEVMDHRTKEKFKKIMGIDGKTQRGNRTEYQNPNHIVSAVDNDGFCVGEVRVNDKSNEIKAIPDLLDSINVKGSIVTIDSMGCQTKIARKIRLKGADYLLALKGNHETLFDNVTLYFADKELLSGCAYTITKEKARSNIETREYWQTDNLSWLTTNGDWADLTTIGMTKNTIIKKDGTETIETRYFISSLPLGVNEMARAIRSHWMVESYHWHLDVTFREDANKTLDKWAAYNLNIIKKLALNTLKLVDVGIKRLSLKKKRYTISLDFERFWDRMMED
jgi:predicted transposase YbfD/YdcC